MFPARGDEHEDWGFSKLHKIILRLDGGDFELEIAQHTAAINAIDSTGRSALYWATKRGDDDVVELLLKANADPNLADNRGTTALSEAARLDSVACMKLLLAANADVHSCDTLLYSALHCAAEFAGSKDLIQLLVQAGADVHRRSIYGGSPLFLTPIHDNLDAATSLLDLGADIESQDHDGDTVLCQTLFQRADEVTRLLLQRGACYTLNDSNGDSRLHLAAKSGGTTTLDILTAAELRGIDPYAENRDGKTAIIIAQERSPMPPGFLEKMYALVMDIEARNLRLAQMPKHDSQSPGGASRTKIPRATAVHKQDQKQLSTRLRKFAFKHAQDWRNISLLILGIAVVVLSMRTAPNSVPVTSSAVSKQVLSTSTTASSTPAPTLASSSFTVAMASGVSQVRSCRTLSKGVKEIMEWC